MERIGRVMMRMRFHPLKVCVALLLAGAASGWAQVPSVDSTTLNGKIMCGYQAWFTAAGYKSGTRWIHWTHDHGMPAGTNLNVEMYPDLREFGQDELFPTAMTRGGQPVSLYAGSASKTIRRHVRWMQEYGIDGVFVQRFLREHYDRDAAYNGLMNEALQGVKTSCGEYGRVFAVMYDVSGMRSNEHWWACMQADWKKLVDEGLTQGGRYVHHNGNPVVGIWGFGFDDRVPEKPDEALRVINWFKSDAPARYRATVFGGVPQWWRLNKWGARTDPGWTNVYRAFNVISPWTVGRFPDTNSFTAFCNNQVPKDLSVASSAGVGYCPVVWPGFSWHNLTRGKGATNQIPRNNGDFYWNMGHKLVSTMASNRSPLSMLYVAMFDEVNEGTAIYKVAPTRADAPDQGYWLTLDADGLKVPSDWYLRLTYDMGRMLRKEIPLTATRPVAPGPQHPVSR